MNKLTFVTLIDCDQDLRAVRECFIHQCGGAWEVSRCCVPIEVCGCTAAGEDPSPS